MQEIKKLKLWSQLGESDGGEEVEREERESHIYTL